MTKKQHKTKQKILLNIHRKSKTKRVKHNVPTFSSTTALEWAAGDNSKQGSTQLTQQL